MAPPYGPNRSQLSVAPRDGLLRDAELRAWRGCGRLRSLGGHAGLGIVGLNDRLGDVGAGADEEHQLCIWIACVQHQRIVLLFGVINQKVADLGGYAVEGLLHVLLEVVLVVFPACAGAAFPFH